MIYLDYSATTPVSLEVQDTINKVTREFIGNANSLNGLGIKSRNLLNSATKQIANELNILESEITYTSSSTESNNLAIIGVALAYFKTGKHIIVSTLEHPDVYDICDYLSSIGFEISYVNVNNDGLIDFDELKRLIRPDTILVSIACVNSELGIRQPLKLIRQIIKKENPKVILHSDMTQAVGKISISLLDTDLATISSHKIYGPKGIAMLYKNSMVKIKPLIFGSGKSNDLKPGTPALPLIVGFSKALRLALTGIEKKEKYINLLNERICLHLKKYDGVLINKTKYSIPHILNISLMNIKPETFIHALDNDEVYVSTNTACASGLLSKSVYALYHDKDRASHTIRISLSSLTTTEEIDKFLCIFDKNYEALNSLVKGD